MKSLIIITGTTRGLGNELESKLCLNKNNYVISINRKSIKKKYSNYKNIFIDLSDIDIENIKKFSTTVNLLLLKNTFERIVFINNAFSITPINKIHELNEEEVIKSCNTNIVSAILLIKEFILLCKDIDIKKDIINISSGASKYPIDKWSIYCLSKAAIEMFLRSIEEEYNVIFNIFNIDPGTMNTEMQKEIQKFR